MPETTGRTVLVTGATAGIGLQTAVLLASAGHQVLLHGRDDNRLAAAAAVVRHWVPAARLGLCRAELGSLAEVHALAAAVKDRVWRLDALINNAGVCLNQPAATVDGFELSFAVNQLAPFLLSHLLLDLLHRAPDGRLINVGSIAHFNGRPDLLRARDLHAFDGQASYADSKLALLLSTFAMARRPAFAGLRVNLIHPGVVSTRLLREGMGLEGPDHLLDAGTALAALATDPAITATGTYFERLQPALPSPLACRADLCDWVYEQCARMTGLVG